MGIMKTKLPFQSYRKEAEFAVSAVSQACQLVRRVRQDMIQAAFTKDDESPVTAADFAAQALIAKNLLEIFPQDFLVGEENASRLRKPECRVVSEKIAHYLSFFYLPAPSAAAICDWIDHGNADPGKRFWTLDPIDGTKGFIRGDQYAVALALIEDGEVKVGVLGCPNLENAHHIVLNGRGTMAVAVHGEGSWWSPLDSPEGTWQRLKVASHSSFAEAKLLRSFETKHQDSPRMTQLIETLGISQPPLFMDSLTKYLLLAAGGADLLFRFPSQGHPHEAVWDQAAGVIIIEEAGGKVTDLLGKDLDFTSGRTLTKNFGVLLSNGRLHDGAVQALKDLGA